MTDNAMLLPPLRQGLEELGLDPSRAEALLGYLDALLAKNEVMNLTAIRDPMEAMRLHLLDACALASPLAALPGHEAASFAGKTVIDVGTGGGVPGMPLKLLCPEAEVTLLDSAEKKVRFLQETADALHLTGITCTAARAEETGLRECFDYAVSRAVARMNILSELCLPFVKVGGVFAAMKSSLSGEELSEAAKGIRTLGGRIEGTQDYTVPGTDVTHRVIWIRKAAPTPAAYPRRYAKIKQRPL